MGTVVEMFLSALLLTIQKAMVALFEFCIGSSLDNFTPSLDYFREMLSMGDMNNWQQLENIVRRGGIAIAVLILMFSFFSIIFVPTMDAMDSPVQVLIGFAVSLLLAVSGQPIVSSVMDVAATILDRILTALDALAPKGLENFENIGKAASSKFYDKFVTNSDDPFGLKAASNFFESDVKSVLTIASAALSVILLLVLFYNLIKLIIELTQRYVTMCCLYLFIPVGGSFRVSNGTRNITDNYFRMMFSEVGLLVFTRVWIVLSMYIIYTFSLDIMGIFVAMSFIRFGISAENNLKAMGLATASTGAALLDSVALSGIAMGRTLGVASSGLAKSIGFASAATGNVTGMKLSNALLGRGVSNETVMQAMNDNVGRIFNNTGDASNTAPLRSDMKEVLDNLGSIENPRNAGEFTKGYRGLSPSQQKEYRNHVANALNNSEAGEAVKMQGAHLAVDTFDFRSGGAMGRVVGNVSNKNGEKLMGDFTMGGFKVSTTPAGKHAVPFTDSEGNQKYINFTGSTENIQTGAIFESNLADGPAGNTMGEIISNVSLNDFVSDGFSGVAKIEKSADGGWNVYEGNNMVGHQFSNGNVAFTGSENLSADTISNAFTDSHGVFHDLGYGSKEGFKITDVKPNGDFTFSYKTSGSSGGSKDSNGGKFEQHEMVGHGQRVVNNLASASGKAWYGDQEIGTYTLSKPQVKSEKNNTPNISSEKLQNPVNPVKLGKTAKPQNSPNSPNSQKPVKPVKTQKSVKP